MKIVSKLQVGEDVYEIKDNDARSTISSVQEDIVEIGTRLDNVEVDTGNIRYIEETETLIIRE